jgi:hypothetical protein
MIAEQDFDPAGPSYTDNGLSPWSAYEYYVVAISPGGRVSPASNTAIATTLIDLSATVTKSGNNRTVNLSWTPKPAGTTVTRFEVVRDGALRATVNDGNATSYADSASKHTTYTYQVKAYDGADLVNQSPTISVYTD